MKGSRQRLIEVWADWIRLGKPVRMRILLAATGKGKEAFLFEYDQSWLKLGVVIYHLTVNAISRNRILSGKKVPARPSLISIHCKFFGTIS